LLEPSWDSEEVAEETDRGLIGLSTSGVLRSIEIGVEISHIKHVVDSEVQELTVVIDAGALTWSCGIRFHETVEDDSVDGKRVSLSVVLKENESSCLASRLDIGLIEDVEDAINAVAREDGEICWGSGRSAEKFDWCTSSSGGSSG